MPNRLRSFECTPPYTPQLVGSNFPFGEPHFSFDPTGATTPPPLAPTATVTTTMAPSLSPSAPTNPQGSPSPSTTTLSTILPLTINISNHRDPLPSGALQWVALWETPSYSWQSRWWWLHSNDFTRNPWSAVCWCPTWAATLPTRRSPHTRSLTWKTAQSTLLLLATWERKGENRDLAFGPTYSAHW